MTIVVAGVVSGVALAIAGGGIGAASLLGSPAPEHVRHEIAAVDRGLPTDLQLDPDVERAHAVASTANATLYAASLRDGGGSCTEIVTADGRGRGATCSAAAAAGAIELTAPSDEGAGPDEGVVIGGRVNPTATQLEVSYPDGSSDRVDLGADRYYLLEVPAQQRASVRAKGLELVSRDREGAVVGRAALPPTGTTRPFPTSRHHCTSARGRMNPTSRRSTGSRVTSLQPARSSSNSTTATGLSCRSRSRPTAATTTRFRPTALATS